MTAGPQDATLNGDGFRFYRWEPADGSAPTDVLSVTSIRKLCGESFNLVNWQLANLADAALGTMKRTVIGPRGGISEKRMVWEFPSQFVRKYEETEGQQPKIDDLRRWLREQADAPRNIAARRGTITHAAIEKNVQWDRIERPYVEAAFLSDLSAKDRKAAKGGVTDEDVHFVRNAVRQYWDMRRTVPFVIIERELQIFNLTAGYAGSADALVWFLPEGVDPTTVPSASTVTLADVRRIGGFLAVLDWKTAADIHTDNVVQITAYISGEFVGYGGVIDQRLTDLLLASKAGGIIHIRPNKWGVYLFKFEEETVAAFLGSVVFARFLAKNPKPDALFFQTWAGESEEEDA